MEPNCVSVNVGPQVGGSHFCELNNATDESSSLSALKKTNGYTYYGVEVYQTRVMNFDNTLSV